MDVNRDTASIIAYSTRTVRIKAYVYFTTKACKMFIYSIIDNFINQVVKATGANASYIPGLFLTASRPSRMDILSAPYFFSAILPPKLQV